MLGWLIERFNRSALIYDQELAVYAGHQKTNDLPPRNEFEFGIYVPVSLKEAIWLPCTATDPDIIAQLETLPVGKVFRVVAEGPSHDPMGTYITQIVLDDALPCFDVPNGVPAELNIS